MSAWIFRTSSILYVVHASEDKYWQLCSYSFPNCSITWNLRGPRLFRLPFLLWYGRKCRFPRHYTSFSSQIPSRYFRHYLSIKILMSTLTEFQLIPYVKSHCYMTMGRTDRSLHSISDAERVLAPLNGTWMPWWVQPLIFSGLGALQLLNMLWFFRMMRLLVRSVLK